MGKDQVVEPVRRKRNKNATRTAILEAVETVLVRDGYPSLGVNSAAREAGVDKVLIYRYFGGMPGLLNAYAEHVGLWPTLEDLAGGDVEAFKSKGISERLTAVCVNCLRALRSKPAACAILAQESSADEALSGVLDSFAQVMDKAIDELLAADAVPGVDFPAVWTLLESSVKGLAVRSPAAGMCCGIDLGDDRNWTRLEAAFRAVVNALWAGRA